MRTTQKMRIQDIHDLVAPDFRAVDDLIHRQLHSDVPLVRAIGQYIVDSGGKRLRPLLVLLAGNAISADSGQIRMLAAVIEFLHTATLLHDDVVDTSTLRRGNATANAKWGNAPSVLVGDFLYSRAFQMMITLKSQVVLEVLANSTNLIAEGEVLQLSNCRNPDVTEETYLKVITAKTARLFEAAARCTGALGQQSDAVTERISLYGCKLGIAFQLADDVLDYTGDQAKMGKNIGDDLAEGKPTLPLIEAQKRANTADREIIRNAIRKGDASNLDQIVDIVNRCGAIDYTISRARTFSADAVDDLLTGLPASTYRDAMQALASIAVDRLA